MQPVAVVVVDVCVYGSLGLLQALKSLLLQHLFFEGTPKTLDLAPGGRTVNLGADMPDAPFLEQFLKPVD